MISGKWAAGCLALASALAGCTPVPPRPITAETNLRAIEQRGLDNPALLAFVDKVRPTPLRQTAGWDLDALTLAALYYSPDVDLARAQWEQARAAVTTATARPNPVLNLNEAYNTTTSGISPWILTNAVDLMFDFSGRREALRVQTTAQAEAARFRLTAAAWQVRSRIRTAMLGVYAARRSVDLLDALAAAQADTVRTAEAMLRLGGISPYEVSQSRTALNATRDAAAQARVRGSDASATLARVIGVTPDALRAVSLDVSTFEALPETMPAPQARHAALLNRADMLAALADYDAAEGAIRVAVAGRAGGDTRLSPGYEFDQGSDKWGLGGGIPLPIFNQNQGPIAEAVAQRAQAQARVDAVQADAISQTDAALAAYRTTRDRVASDTQAASDLDRQMAVARARVTAGEASRFELAQRSLEIANAAIAREAAILAAQEARGRLEDALQQPTFPFPSPDAAPRTEANAR